MRILVLGYLLTSGVTWVFGSVGDGVLGRLTIADVTMVAMICTSVVRNRMRWRIPASAIAAIVMLVTFFPGIVLSAKPEESLAEFAILGFLVVGHIVLYDYLVSLESSEFWSTVRFFSIAGSFLAVFGILDACAGFAGLPTAYSMANPGHGFPQALVGTFRNTGQAGAFFVTTTLLTWGLLETARFGGDRTLRAALIVQVLALLLTVKRAALITLMLALVAHLVAKKKWSSGIAVLACIAGAVLAFQSESVSSLVPGYRARVERKLYMEGNGIDEDSFVAQNLGVAANAFLENPVIGAGLGGISGVYSNDYEIHGTYPAVLGTTGLLGLFGYCVFVAGGLGFISARSRGETHSEYLRSAIPSLVALFIGYAYTNHLRKREFWVLWTFLQAAWFLLRRSRPATRPSRAWGGRRRPPALLLPPAGK